MSRMTVSLPLAATALCDRRGGLHCNRLWWASARTIEPTSGHIFKAVEGARRKLRHRYRDSNPGFRTENPAS